VETAAVPLLVLAQMRAAFREEVFYRAFLFGQLFRHGRWGFIPAVGLSALIFAFSHLYQATTLFEGAAIFVVTFVGAVWFAWLYVVWGDKVWLPVGLHFFMNLWWDLFRVGETAFSGALGRRCRACSR
jgi:membrane protease YdiL (CAAX protease family)